MTAVDGAGSSSGAVVVMVSRGGGVLRAASHTCLLPRAVFARLVTAPMLALKLGGEEHHSMWFVRGMLRRGGSPGQAENKTANLKVSSRCSHSWSFFPPWTLPC